MADKTGIQWADSTVNFWWGCTKVSAACDHCYAETWANRFGGEHWGSGAPRRKIKGARALLYRLDNDYSGWAADFYSGHLPPGCGSRRRVFCMSMGDLFDNDVPLDWFVEAWRTIVACDRVDIIIVTKRVAMIEKRLEQAGFKGWPQHAWLLTSVHDQESADRETVRLLNLKSTFSIPIVGFSIEPMLGAIDLTRPLDWVIAGGESGPDARPMHPAWARSLRDQCAAAGVPFFFKQWGEWEPREAIPIAVDARDCPEGTLEDNGDGKVFYAGSGRSVTLLRRVGKRCAGRLLDGREHNGFPERSR